MIHHPVNAPGDRASAGGGASQLRLDVPEVETIEALIASERLTEQQALDRRLVERELAIVLADWAKRWKIL